MSKEKMHFMGLLANVDSSILKVELKHGFEIKYMSDGDGIRFISNLENLPIMDIASQLRLIHRVLNIETNEHKMYYISNCFEIDMKVDEKGNAFFNMENFPKMDKTVEEYLDPTIRLMRLYKRGNICIPKMHYYYFHNDFPKSYLRPFSFIPIAFETFTLRETEMNEMNDFISDTKIPFSEKFLQLAFENFELSYLTLDINLSFLSLMISLEALFNRGKPELRYTISRNIAVLLGRDKEDSYNIFQGMKKLYDKRSAIVHSGESNIISEDDLSKLRHYVRESIKEILKIGKNKDDVFGLLNSCGFGERLWKN